jgi:CRP-like cAMP-binding protein
MPPEQVRPLADFFDREAFDTGTMIFAQDALAERLYILLRGHVAIRFKPYDGDLLAVTEICAGGVFGWSAALGRRHYTSSAVCTEDSEALSIRGSDLRHLCERYPETGVVVLERLAEVIAERLRSTHEQVVDLLRVSMRSPRGDLPEI